MRTSIPAAFAAVLILLSGSCASQRKLESIRNSSKTASLSLPLVPEKAAADEVDIDEPMVKGEDGRDLHIMNAVRDEATGEMVATEQLRAAVLVARFRNVAERLMILCGPEITAADVIAYATPSI